MSKLCCVPQEWLGQWLPRSAFPRPPLPADIEAALELAKRIAAHYDHLRIEYPGTWGQDTTTTSEEIIARALLKCNGREP